MQQLPDLLLHHQHSAPQLQSSTPLQSADGIVVGLLYVPVADVTTMTHNSILARNGWNGVSHFDFDASPEDDGACCCMAIMMDMGGLVMQKTTSSSSSSSSSSSKNTNKPLGLVSSSDWATVEGSRRILPQDIICVTYTPRSLSSSSSSSSSSTTTSHSNFGGWTGGSAEIRVYGGNGGFHCRGDVPEGHVAGGQPARVTNGV
jgi:hypothetical protein